MNLIITRNFPPDVGGMQNLMFGLTKSLSEHMMVKVFADEHYQQDKFDEDLSFSIERVGVTKIIRKSYNFLSCFELLIALNHQCPRWCHLQDELVPVEAPTTN